MPSQFPQQLLTPKEAAAFIGRSMSIMAKERCFGGGPKFIKLGQSVRYDLRHLEEYIAARVRRSTSDDGERAA